MPYMLDENIEHVMRSWLGKEGYLTLAWPRELSLCQLNCALELVTLQLNTFRKHARQKEAGELEYESWTTK